MYKRQAGAAHDLAGLGVRDGGVEVPGDAEVDDAGALGGQQHVAGLQVAVDEARLVDRDQRRRRPERHAVREVGGERAPRGDDLGEGRAGDVLGDEVGPVAVGAVLEDGGGAERHHAPGEGDLLGEPRAERRVAEMDGVWRLERDQTALSALGEIDHAHPAGTETAEQKVAPDDHRVAHRQRPNAWRHPAGDACSATCHPEVTSLREVQHRQLCRSRRSFGGN